MKGALLGSRLRQWLQPSGFEGWVGEGREEMVLLRCEGSCNGIVDGSLEIFGLTGAYVSAGGLGEELGGERVV